MRPCQLKAVSSIILYSVEILPVSLLVVLYVFRLDVHKTSESKTTKIGCVMLCIDNYLLFFQDCLTISNLIP